MCWPTPTTRVTKHNTARTARTARTHSTARTERTHAHTHARALSLELPCPLYRCLSVGHCCHECCYEEGEGERGLCVESRCCALRMVSSIWESGTPCRCSCMMSESIAELWSSSSCSMRVLSSSSARSSLAWRARCSRLASAAFEGCLEAIV